MYIRFLCLSEVLSSSEGEGHFHCNAKAFFFFKQDTAKDAHIKLQRLEQIHKNKKFEKFVLTMVILRLLQLSILHKRQRTFIMKNTLWKEKYGN